MMRSTQRVGVSAPEEQSWVSWGKKGGQFVGHAVSKGKQASGSRECI